MVYLLLDESGDLGFSLGEGSSRYFIVTALVCESKRPLEKIARRVLAGLRERHRTPNALHAYVERPITRIRLLREVAILPVRVIALIVEKGKVPKRMRNEKSTLYNELVGALLDRLFSKHFIQQNDSVEMIASQRETNRFLKRNFEYYVLSGSGVRSCGSMNVRIADPTQEKSLQVVDFVSWAIFRKYEYTDSSYADLIDHLIIDEQSILV